MLDLYPSPQNKQEKKTATKICDLLIKNEEKPNQNCKLSKKS